MLSHGDEIARTQGGNNNAYCQDNEITWMNWTLDERQVELLEFTRKIIAIRQANPVLRRRHFFRGQIVSDDGVKDLSWIRTDGKEMTEADWRNPSNHVLGMLIHGDATDEMDARGRPIRGDTLLFIVNGGPRTSEFTLPRQEVAGQWVTLVHTASHLEHGEDDERVQLEPHALILLRYGMERRGIEG